MTPQSLFAANVGLAHWCVRGFGLTPGDADYDDMAQEALITLWDVSKRFDASRGCKFSTYAVLLIRRRLIWVRHIADRCGFTRVGDGYRMGRVVRSPISFEETMVGREEVNDSDADHVWAEVARLPGSRQREVLTLAYRHGLSDAEIGASLGIKTDAAKANRQSGIAVLRRRMVSA